MSNESLASKAKITETRTPSESANESSRLQKLQEFVIRRSMIFVMVIIVLYFSTQSDRFLSVGNLQGILIAAAPFALIAIGQTLVILTGGIDLSQGSIIALSAMSSAAFVKQFPDQIFVALLVGVTVGVLAGMVSGFLVAREWVPPFIATLAMLSIASGLAYVVGGGAPINGLTPTFGTIANTTILGVSFPVLLMVLGLIAAGLLMQRTRYGNNVYAVGGNRFAAQIAGISAKRVTFSVYVISGSLAGLSGVFLASRVGSGSPTLGSGFELDAIAAVVIGGTSLFGGRGTIWGTALGLILIQTLNNGLDIMLVPSYWQNIIKGLLIIAAVVVDVWSSKRR